jgi:hypothetical protein
LSERTNRKIPVNDRQFAWVQNDDNGEIVLFAGPSIVSPTANERVVVDDGKGGFVEDMTGKPQQMIDTRRSCTLWSSRSSMRALRPPSRSTTLCRRV